MSKKIISLVCLILAGLLCFHQFVNNTPQKTVIQFSSWGSESEIKILKPILIEFEKENPDIQIDFLHIPQNYFQKLHLLFASNTAPDVILINNQYLPLYANAGMLENLNQYKNELKTTEFYPKAIESLTWENNNYAIPRDISNLVIYYNKSIFDNKKIPYPQKGWNYEQFLTTAKKLTDAPNIFGISFEEEPLFYMPYLTNYGIDYVPNFEDEKTKIALQKYADLRFKEKIAPLKEHSASATMAQMFLQGRLAMYLSGRWLVPKFRQDAKFDWDIVEFPGQVPMDASGWAISKASKNKTESLKLIKYLSSKESIEKFTESGLIVPARIDVAESKTFLDNKKPLNSRVFLDIIKTSKPTPVSINYKKTLDELKIKSEYLFNTKKD